MPTAIDASTRQTTGAIKAKLNDLIGQVRDDIDKTDDPKAKALFETTAEVLIGLKTAYDHYEQGTEAAWR
jgi:hypothetical protein